jgi:hypothetical protein
MDDDLSVKLKDGQPINQTPKDGDIGFCGRCGRPHVLIPNGTRRLSAEEWIDVRTHIPFMQNLAYVTSWVQYQETLQ